MRRLVWFTLAAAVAVLAGFLAFVESLPKREDTSVKPADGIVALTGEGRRLMPAMDLLERGLGRRLLITGVNPARIARLGARFRF